MEQEHVLLFVLRPTYTLSSLSPRASLLGMASENAFAVNVVDISPFFFQDTGETERREPILFVVDSTPWSCEQKYSVALVNLDSLSA